MAEKGFGVKEINLIGASGTPTIESPNNLNLNAVNVAISTNATIGGNLTVTGNIGIAGTLTYEDVTNVDSIGIVTAREGIKIPDDKEITFGAGGDGFIKSDGANFLIQGGGGGTGTTYVRGRTLRLSANGGSGGFNGAVTIDKSGDERVQLKYGSGTKLVTTSSGITVTGTLAATAVTGDGSALTGIAVTEAPVTDYTISANGSSAYRIHGGGVDETANSPDLYLIRGQKYRFNNTTGSGHPFALRVSNGGSAYTDGVSGSQSGTQFFTVPYAAPASLVYQCTIHSGMIGNIYIRGGSSTVTVSTNADNRIITGGSGGNLNGESTFTYDGSATVALANANPQIRLTDTNDSNKNFDMVISGGNAFLSANSSGMGMNFEVTGSTRLRVTSNGKVNIGTSELDQTDRMLNVYGGRMRIGGISSGNSFEIMNSASAGQSNGILCQAGTNSSDYNSTFRNTSGDTLLRIRGDGKIGINETSPDSLLHITTNAGGTTDLLTLHADAQGSNNGVASIKLMGNSGNHAAFIKGGHTTNGDTILTFHTDAHASGINPEERLRINSNGAFGLGGANYGSSGQVLTSQGSGSVVQWAAAGQCIQRVNTTYSTQSSNSSVSSNTDLYTGHQATITPVGTNSEVLVYFSYQVWYQHSSATTFYGFPILKCSINGASYTDVYDQAAASYVIGNISEMSWFVQHWFLHDPSYSAGNYLRYRTYWRHGNPNNVQSLVFNRNSAKSEFHLLEFRP